MKISIKLFTALLGASLMAGTAVPAHAEYREPSRHHRDAAGAALVAGIATVGVIAALAHHHDYRPERSYCAPPPPPPRMWVPSHFETRAERVLVPGYWETVPEPIRHHPGHGWGHCHHERETRQVWVPERYEWRETQVWVPGHYEMARAY